MVKLDGGRILVHECILGTIHTIGICLVPVRVCVYLCESDCPK